MWTWKAETPAIVPAGARISAGKSGCVARSLPNTADDSVNRSPESPANLITTSPSVSTPRAEAASTVTVDHQLSQYLSRLDDTAPSGCSPRVFIGRAQGHCTHAVVELRGWAPNSDGPRRACG